MHMSLYVYQYVGCVAVDFNYFGFVFVIDFVVEKQAVSIRAICDL